MIHLKFLEIASNHLKNYLNCFKYNIFVQKIFSKSFREYIRMGNSNYKNENIETKYFNNMRKNQFLKGKNGILRLEKYFIELKDRE